MDDKQLITIRRLLDCGVVWPVDQAPNYATILRWMHNGRNGKILEHIKTGKTIYTSIAWVRDYLDSQRRSVAADDPRDPKKERRASRPRSSVGYEAAMAKLRSEYGY